MPHVNQYKTAIANGYSIGQAQALELWPEFQFVQLITDMIRPDNKPKEWILKEK